MWLEMSDRGGWQVGVPGPSGTLSLTLSEMEPQEGSEQGEIGSEPSVHGSLGCMWGQADTGGSKGTVRRPL